jgi:hypothetical protein
MNSKDDIISILEAINKINSKSKNKNEKSSKEQRSVPKLNQALVIPPDVDRLIREAEEYKKTSNIHSNISPSHSQSDKPKNEEVLILTDEIIDNSENENTKIIELNKKVESLEQLEKKLRFQISSLQKENDLLSQTKINSLDPPDSSDLIKNTKETLRSIYSQVEKQKQNFLELKEHSNKIERDSSVYKENYERLVIENNELNIRLKISKEQIINYESNKNDLLAALERLNEILSKSNVVGKISPLKTSSIKSDQKKSSKIEPID